MNPTTTKARPASDEFSCHSSTYLVFVRSDGNGIPNDMQHDFAFDNIISAMHAYRQVRYDQIQSPDEVLATVDRIRRFLEIAGLQPNELENRCPPRTNQEVVNELDYYVKRAQSRLTINEAKFIFEKLDPAHPDCANRVRRLRTLMTSVNAPLRYLSPEETDQQIDAKLIALESASRTPGGRNR